MQLSASVGTKKKEEPNGFGGSELLIYPYHSSARVGSRPAAWQCLQLLAEG